MASEILALLLPAATQGAEEAAPFATALLRDAEGTMSLRTLRTNLSLLAQARIAGRFDSGKPIVDPQTREIIGYEIEPIPVG